MQHTLGESGIEVSALDNGIIFSGTAGVYDVGHSDWFLGEALKGAETRSFWPSGPATSSMSAPSGFLFSHLFRCILEAETVSSSSTI